jgi:hypothetical protein
MKIALTTIMSYKPEPPIACGKNLRVKSSTLNSQDQIQQIMTKSLLNWIRRTTNEAYS